VQGGTGGTTTGVYYPATNQLALATNGTQALLVDSSQNVGIGTASPSYKLEARGELAASNGTYGTILTYSVGNQTGILGTYGNHGLEFRTNNTDRMRIDTSGRVIVGYTASVGTAYQTSIQVKGASPFSASNYAGYGLITSNNESAGLFGVYSNGENSLWIASDPDNLKAGSRTVFTVDGTQTAQINPFGIGVGTATPTSGTGIAFPATQSASSDANTLDDYEEGSWTPIDNSGAGLNMSGSAGSYTKIGRLVNVRAKILYPSTSNTAASFISGLPFTLASQTAGNYPGNAINANGNTNAGFALAYEGSTQVTLMNVLTQSQATNNNLSSANINFSLTYMTS
jgi:hypothetical protein